jgi:hypothetical protein
MAVGLRVSRPPPVAIRLTVSHRAIDQGVNLRCPSAGRIPLPPLGRVDLHHALHPGSGDSSLFGQRKQATNRSGLAGLESVGFGFEFRPGSPGIDGDATPRDQAEAFDRKQMPWHSVAQPQGRDKPPRARLHRRRCDGACTPD